MSSGLYAISQNDLVYILTHMTFTDATPATLTKEDHWLRLCPLIFYPKPDSVPTGENYDFGPMDDFLAKYLNHGAMVLGREIDASKFDPTLSQKAMVYDIVVSLEYFTNEVLTPANNKPLLMYLCACHSTAWASDCITHGVKLYLGNEQLLTYTDWEVPLSYYLFHYMVYGCESPPETVDGYSSLNLPGIPGEPDWLPPERPMDVLEALKTLEYYDVNPARDIWWNNDAQVIPYYDGAEAPKIYFQGNANIVVSEE